MALVGGDMTAVGGDSLTVIDDDGMVVDDMADNALVDYEDEEVLEYGMALADVPKEINWPAAQMEMELRTKAALQLRQICATYTGLDSGSWIRRGPNRIKKRIDATNTSP